MCIHILILHSCIAHKAKVDDETDAESSEEEEQPKKMLKRPAAANWCDSSDDEEASGEDGESRDRNVAIWFRKHQGSLSKD